MTDLSADPIRPSAAPNIPAGSAAPADARLQVLAAELARVKAEQEADAAERRRLRDELRELTRQHELVVNAASEGIIGLDGEGRFTFANPAVSRMTGWALQDLIGRQMHETIHHKHSDGTPYPIEDCPMHAGYTAGVAQHVRDAVFWRRDGSAFPVEYVCTPVRERSEVVGAVVVVRDITEQKRGEDALRRSHDELEARVSERTAALAAANDALRGSEARYRVVAETASDAIVTIDEDSTVLFVNPAATKIFGHEREKMLGQELTMLMPEALRIVHKLGLRRYLDTGRRHMAWEAVQVPGLHKDGREIPLEVSFRELEHEGRHLFTGIVRDISDRKLAERRLIACYAVTRVLATTPGAAAFPEVLRLVGEALDWAWGELWLLDPDTDTLRATATWRAAAMADSEFDQVTARIHFSRGVGLPGRIWARGEAVWIVDVLHDDNFPRAPQAAAAGLHAALGFPVRSGDEFFGVMEFFCHEVRPPDEQLLDLMASIGLQLGQHIALQRAREALAR